MTFCTNCGTQNDDIARVCTNCGTQLGTGSQGGQNPYQTSGPSSYPPSGSAPYPPAGAPQPPPANPYGATPPPPPYGQGYNDPYSNQQPYAPTGYSNQPYGMQPGGGYAGGYQGGGGLMAVGEKREPGMVILFTILTCGIYGIWFFHTYASEIKNALGRQDLNPTTDLLLSFVTCGIWTIVAFYYKYPKLITDLQQRVGLPPNDISGMTVILGIFFAPVALYMIQSELNKVWDAAGAR